jgi:hypothetical protein
MLLRSLVILSALMGATAFADAEIGVQSGDLVLPGERWVTGFNGYTCDGGQTLTTVPAEYAASNVQFERFSTDRTLRNAITSATFTEDGVQCRYTALVKADLPTQTAQILESKAYAPNGGSECVSGKALIDGQLHGAHFTFNERVRPHHFTMQFAFIDAQNICGVGATAVGVDFILKRKIDN